jgi:hypothetical protein
MAARRQRQIALVSEILRVFGTSSRILVIALASCGGAQRGRGNRCGAEPLSPWPRREPCGAATRASPFGPSQEKPGLGRDGVSAASGRSWKAISSAFPRSPSRPASILRSFPASAELVLAVPTKSSLEGQPAVLRGSVADDISTAYDGMFNIFGLRREAVAPGSDRKRALRVIISATDSSRVTDEAITL